MRAVSVLEVSRPEVWDELHAVAELDDHLGEPLDDHRRIANDSFERAVMPHLAELGVQVLVRYARRDSPEAIALTEGVTSRVHGMRPSTRRVLHVAQRHALDDVVLGIQAWDPLSEAADVRALVSAGLLVPASEGEAPLEGRYRLHPDLPPPPPVAYDFAEAAMDETDDLSEPRPGPVALLHDLAALAAALHRVVVRRTHGGTIARTDARRLGRQLGSGDVANDGRLEDDSRWSRALQALEALGAVSMDPLSRELFLDLGVEHVLTGSTEDALNRFVHRLVDRDLHVVLPAVRSALHAAGEGAVDEVVFLDLLREQHRDVLFPPWRRDGALWYPAPGNRELQPLDDASWESVETPMIRAALSRMERLGLLRRAPGVFAGTADGRLWAGAAPRQAPPVWVSSDLEITVPPESVTPWERFQLERLGRCLTRDVVDRYRLERGALVQWLSIHELDEATDLLARRCPSVPTVVTETLREWERSATRVVLTRGVLLPT